MRARAPGKVLLTGAYAVLEGAPALVAAVNRYAVANLDDVDPVPSREVAAAFPEGTAPRVDVRHLFEEERKLGLGSSAAAVVAALGAEALRRGEDLARRDVRSSIFKKARWAHAQAQSGGSGVDVAASVFGGVLRYELAGDEARWEAVSLPPGLHVHLFFSGASARTSDLRGRVDAFRMRDRSGYDACFSALVQASHGATMALGDALTFVEAAEGFRQALARLGREADAPIETPAFAELAPVAHDEDAVFLPSGAGGGDVGVFLGLEAPSSRFQNFARTLGMAPVLCDLDTQGVAPCEGRNVISKD
jgi:phosphomevalonate kinase